MGNLWVSQWQVKRRWHLKMLIFHIYSFTIFIPDVSSYWKINANKNSPMLYMKTDASKWSEFPEDCNNKFTKLRSIIFISLHNLQKVYGNALIMCLKKKNWQTKYAGKVMSIFFDYKDLSRWSTSKYYYK